MLIHFQEPLLLLGIIAAVAATLVTLVRLHAATKTPMVTIVCGLAVILGQSVFFLILGIALTLLNPRQPQFEWVIGGWALCGVAPGLFLLVQGTRELLKRSRDSQTPKESSEVNTPKTP